MSTAILEGLVVLLFFAVGVFTWMSLRGEGRE